MKLLFGILLLFANNCLGQCYRSKIFDASIFNTTLKKSRDTIYFTATLLSVGKVSQRECIVKLHSKKLINKKYYTTGIEFIPKGYDQKLYLPINDFLNQNDKLGDYNFYTNRTICIRGIVHKGYEKWNAGIFFLVDKIDFL